MNISALLKLLSQMFLTFIIYCFILILMPIMWALIIFFYSFKKLLELYLMIKFRRKFGGMLYASDELMLEKDTQKNIISSILIIKTENDITDVFQKITAMVEYGVKHAEKFPKLSSTVHSCCGYGYLLRKDIDVHQCVRTITVDEDSDKTIKDVLYEINKSELPYDNKFLWQFVLVTGPNEWKLRQNIREDQMYLLLRVHHVFGDGLSIIKAFIGMHSSVDLSNIKKVLGKANKKNNILVKMLELICFPFLLPHTLMINKARKSSSLGYMEPTGSETTSSRKFYFKIDEDDTIIRCVKRIKKAIGNTAFVEVVLTSISASLERYSANNCISIPEAAITVAPTMHIDMNERKKDVETKNRFGLLVFQMPISLESLSLSDRLTELKKATRKIANSGHLKVTFLLINYIIGLFPNNLARYLFNVDNYGICFSNIPSLPKVRLLNGLEIEHMVFFPPVKGASGVAFGLSTFDDKIHLGLAVNDKIMINHEDCQKIVDDVFQFIRLFDEELHMKELPTKFVSIKL
ncbi:uncharacterized protein LOC130892880 [Diorhabda carinulata]|uniref:uncharacterized protein LOC130892880 n=1 Tax=Diorhabda carinulata TaxID=1163345 RepID=UPI0025A1164E|nr:uncharacterized protein LOC130892880 [Diorhabda carinulata]